MFFNSDPANSQNITAQEAAQEAARSMPQATSPQTTSSQAIPAHASTPQQSPLDQLKDIHLPENIDQFPNAIGWWILLGMVIAIILFFLVKSIKKHRALRYLRSAKNELGLIAKQEPNSQSIAKISGLLKRVCLLYFPTSQVASLNGKDWWEFLNKVANKPVYDKKMVNQLTQVRYQKESKLTKTEWEKFVTDTENCLELIVNSSIKKKRKLETKGDLQ